MRTISSKPSAGVKKRVSVTLENCHSLLTGSASGAGRRDGYSAARANIAEAQQITERRFDIDIGLKGGDVFDQAAQTAGADPNGTGA